MQIWQVLQNKESQKVYKPKRMPQQFYKNAQSLVSETSKRWLAIPGIEYRVPLFSWLLRNVTDSVPTLCKFIQTSVS